MIFFGKQVSNIPIIFSSLAIITSILLGSPNIIIITISLVILFKLFSPLPSKVVFDSYLFTIILIFFSYIILLQCTVLISWLISHDFSLSYTPLLLFGFILVMYLYNHLLHKKDVKIIPIKDNRKIVNVQDILSLSVATIIIFLIAIPPMIQARDYSESTFAMSIINGNVDDSSHLGLVNDHLQFGKGVIFHSDATDKTRTGSFYPAGWHSISAVLIKTFNPTIETGSASLIAYSIQKLFWVFILTYLFSRVSFTIYRFLSNSKLKAASYIWTTAAILFFSFIMLLPISKEGFYSFLPQLLSAMLALPILAQICLEKDTKLSYRSLPFLLIICLGGCLAWLLPLPAFALAVLLVIIRLVINRKVKIIFKNIYKIIKDNLIVLILLFSALITQLLIMGANKENSVSFINGILLDGGITMYNNFLYIFICVGFLASLLLASAKAKKNIHLLIYLVVSILLFCSFLYLVQLILIGRNAYYFYKTLDILIMVSLPFCIAGFGLIIKNICNKEQITLAISLSIMILASSAIIIGLDRSTLGYASGYRAFSSQIDNSIINELGNNITQDNYFKKSYSFYYVPDSGFYFQNELSVMLVKSNELDSSCFNSIRHSIWDSPPIEKLLGDIKKECSDYNISLVTNQASYDNFSQAVINMGLEKSVKIKTY